MSFAERALRRLREVMVPQGGVEQPAVREVPGVATAVARRSYEEIARALGAGYKDVEAVCKFSADAEEWCEWVADLLRGKRRDPPNRPLPDRVLALLQWLLERGVRDPLLEQVVDARRLVAKAVAEASEKARQAVEDVARGKHRVALEKLSHALESVSREVKRLRGDPEEAVKAVLGELERELRGKYRVRVSEGELVGKVIEELRRSGLEGAVEKTVKVIEAKLKAPSTTTPEAVKRLGEQGGQAEQLELVKKPVAKT